jgi:FkbM family methyltransferase
MSINEHINDYVKPLIMPEKYKARLRVLSTNLSFQPRTVLDIGAYEGHWSQGIKDVFPNCNVFMIEGDEDKYTHLNRTGLPFAIALLSDKEKEVTFHKTNSLYTTGNSIYRELSPTFDHSNPRYYSVQRITQTLSNVVRNNNIKNIDLVKIDVQGSEKDIILGGVDVIRQARVVILEVAITEYNQGAPKILEMLLLMEQLGFRVYDIFEIMYSAQDYHLEQLELCFIQQT